MCPSVRISVPGATAPLIKASAGPSLRSGMRAILTLPATSMMRPARFPFVITVSLTSTAMITMDFGVGLPAPNADLSPANVRIVYLDLAAELLSLLPDHRLAEFVVPGPGGVVTIDSHGLLEVQGTAAELRSDHISGDPEQIAERCPCPREHRSRRHRTPLLAPSALPLAVASSPSLRVTAERADKSIRPPELLQVGHTPFFRGEHGLELAQCARIARARN